MSTKRITEVSPCRIKLFRAYFHFLMGSFHISTLVLIGSSSYECYKFLLALPLLGHIGIREVVVDNWVFHHELIKLINN